MSTYGAGYEGPDPSEGPDEEVAERDADLWYDQYREREDKSITSGILKIKQLADEIRALKYAPLCDDPTHPIFGV